MRITRARAANLIAECVGCIILRIDWLLQEACMRFGLLRERGSWVAATLIFACLVGCKDDSGETAKTDGGGAGSTGGAAKVDAGAPEAGVIKGTAKTEDGRPIKSFGGSIY